MSRWHPYPSDTMGPCPICGGAKTDSIHSSRGASEHAPSRRTIECVCGAKVDAAAFDKHVLAATREAARTIMARHLASLAPSSEETT